MWQVTFSCVWDDVVLGHLRVCCSQVLSPQTAAIAHSFVIAPSSLVDREWEWLAGCMHLILLDHSASGQTPDSFSFFGGYAVFCYLFMLLLQFYNLMKFKYRYLCTYILEMHFFGQCNTYTHGYLLIKLATFCRMWMGGFQSDNCQLECMFVHRQVCSSYATVDHQSLRSLDRVVQFQVTIKEIVIITM